MAFEMPLDQIKDLRTLLRREANLSWYDPEKEESLALPKLPSVAETIAKLDPSPPYLRCKSCNGRLIRDLQSSICVFCGTNPHRDLTPEPIKFKSTVGYRWLLEALQLDGSEMVAPVVDENAWNRGRSESKDDIPIPVSEVLDLEIRWPSEAERAQSSTPDPAAFEGNSSLNLAGVDLDSFFDRREFDSDVFEQNLASGRQVGGISDNGFKANENLSLFQNDQASEVAAGSAENQSGDSFSGWEASFMSASSGPIHEVSKSVEWNDFSGSASMQDPSSTISSSKTTDQAGNVGFSVDFNDPKTSQDANSSSSKDVDWIQDQWQDNNNKKNIIGADEATVSFDAWNDFPGSVSTRNSSFGVSNSQITGETSLLELTKDPNDTKNAENATGSSSNFDWMQDDLGQQSGNKATGHATTNEVDDEFDVWNDFTSSAISQNPSDGVSNSAITALAGKSEITASLNDMKTEEGTNASSRRSFDWMQDDQWQDINNKTTDTRTTNDSDSFDVWNDLTSLASTQDHSSNVWKHTLNQTSAEKTSETNLFSSSNSSHDKDFSGFSQDDLFLGQFGSSPSSIPATSSNRVAEVDITRGNSGNVSSAVGSKDDAEMLMSQMHDLSFMLKNNLSIPPK